MNTGIGTVGAGWIADRYYAVIQQVDSLRVVAPKHVLVEKPVALRLEEIQEIKRRAEKQRLVAFPGHNFVYRPVTRKARELIDQGTLGTISYARFRSIHFIPEEHAKGWRRELRFSGGGAMMDSGTHLVYQSLFLLGVSDCLNCYTARLHYLDMDGEDTCQLSVQYPSGAIGSISQVWSARVVDANEIRIVGDEDNIKITDALYVNGANVESDSEYENSFYHLSIAFSDPIRRKTQLLSDLDAAAKTIELIQRGYEIARKRNQRTENLGAHIQIYMWCGFLSVGTAKSQTTKPYRKYRL